MRLTSVPRAFRPLSRMDIVGYSRHIDRNKVVADTLQVSGDDEVEDWVLQAIQTGLMEAKMDQMQRVVVIRRCTNRVFGPAQWKVRRHAGPLFFFFPCGRVAPSQLPHIRHKSRNLSRSSAVLVPASHPPAAGLPKR